MVNLMCTIYIGLEVLITKYPNPKQLFASSCFSLVLFLFFKKCFSLVIYLTVSNYPFLNYSFI